MAGSAPGGGHFIDELEVGMADQVVREVTEDDIIAFAKVSGDDNPVHLDADFAAATPFRERIAHGMLTAGYISAVLGTRLPGPGAIYMSQSLKFMAPVKIGDEVTAEARITHIDREKRRVTLDCTASVAGKPVMTGEALIMAPKRPS
jgi:3-hydroxybutyryl-CoA dehydratase